MFGIGDTTLEELEDAFCDGLFHLGLERCTAVLQRLVAILYDACERQNCLRMGLSRCWVRSSRLQVNVTSGSDARSGAPCLEGFGTELTLRCRCDEMATDVESVVDRGMYRKESLSRSG